MMAFWISVGFLPGLVVGFFVGLNVRRAQAREIAATILGVLILLAWIASVICSITIGYQIPLGIHTVAGLAAGWFFGQDVLRRKTNGK